MTEPTLADLHQWMAELSTLSKEEQEITAPYDSQIKALQAEMAEKTAALTFQMDTLKTLIKPAILALRQTQKVPYVTVSYVHKDDWDKDMLFAMAKEVPAIMQAHKDASSVRFLKTSH